MKTIILPTDNCPRAGISVLELVASGVILSVIAAASIASLRPGRAGQEPSPIVAADLQSLGGLTQTYRIETGRYPARGVADLIDAGYLPSTEPGHGERAARLAGYDYDPITGRFELPRRRLNIGTSINP